MPDIRVIPPSISSKLNKILSLPAKGDEQDWDIELADKNRIEQFLDVFEKSGLNLDEQYALMALIIASYNSLLDDGLFHTNTWNRIVRNIHPNADLKKQIKSYWGQEKNDATCEFSIGPLVRDL